MIVSVLWLFLTVLLVGLQCVSVAFSLTHSLTFCWFEPNHRRSHCVVSFTVLLVNGTTVYMYFMELYFALMLLFQDGRYCSQTVIIL